MLNETILGAQNHGEQAMETLMRMFKPKVTAISREYFLLGADFDDLIQEGMIGLYKAVMVYDAQKNHNFASFASLCIHRQLQNAVKNAGRKKNAPLNSYVPISRFDDRNDDEEVLKLVIADDESNIEQNIINKEMQTIVISKVKNILTEEQFNLLKQFLNGYSYEHMAKNANLTVKQVDNNLQAIKRKLKTIKGEM